MKITDKEEKKTAIKQVIKVQARKEKKRVDHKKKKKDWKKTYLGKK